MKRKLANERNRNRKIERERSIKNLVVEEAETETLYPSMKEH